MKSEMHHLVFLAVLAVVLLTANLGGYDLWPPDEPRYAQVAWEMLSSGDYLLPRVNNQPYTEKPPLLFWMIAAASLPGGDVTAWTARIPSVIAGLIVLLFTYLLAKHLFNRHTAFWSVLILLTMQRFWWNARCGQIDMLLTACVIIGLYAFMRWETDKRYFWLILFYLTATAGLYAKGPGTLVFPVLFVLAWSWPQQERRRYWIQLGLGGAMALILYALWAAPAHMAAAHEAQTAAADTFASNMFRQTIGRFLLGVSHANWPWYYLTTLPVDWLPWTLFLPWTLLWTWRHRRENAAIRFLLCSTLPAFIFFTIAIGKRNVYLLPLFPSFAMLFALSIQELMNSDPVKWRKGIGIALLIVLLIIAAAPAALFLTPYKNLWTPSLFVISGAALLPAYLLLRSLASSRTTNLHQLTAAMFVLLSLSGVWLAFPLINVYKSARDFCAPVRQLAEQQEDFDLYTIGFAREEYLFYSRHFFKELYTEVIPLEHGHNMNPMALARFQNDLSHAIGKATAKVDIKDIKSISPEEWALLQQAIRNAVLKEEYAPELIADFKEALAKAGRDFFKAFESSRPAYLYVQEYDWRWIYALHPDIQDAKVLHEELVGRRHVLLIANPAGEALLDKV